MVSKYTSGGQKPVVKISEQIALAVIFYFVFCRLVDKNNVGMVSTNRNIL